jgi:NAD(P) transhydrogenase subunit alpha
VLVQARARASACAPDDAYVAAGVEITDGAGAFLCDIVLKVRGPSPQEMR